MSGTTSNQRLKDWVTEWAAVMQPADIYWCDGSAEEYDELCQELVDSGTFTKLDEAKRPNSYWAHSDPGDVARVEDRTFICSRTRTTPARTTTGATRRDARRDDARCTGLDAGRTMYVVPFSMGPLGSHIAHIGVQLTDSAYVAVNMRIMTRMGQGALDVLGDGEWVPCLHSVGAPLGRRPGGRRRGRATRQQVHRALPRDPRDLVVRLGYGGNALLGKKCFALRIASVMARDDGWLAEHMLILKLTNPEGESKYIAAAFPSACGKTNLAMLVPTIPGWKAETIGDDICWMKFGDDGRLYAINPEPGSSASRRAPATTPTPTRWTRCGATASSPTPPDRRRRRLVGGDDRHPARHATDWKGAPGRPRSRTPAAHPNARFTVPAAQCPSIAPSGRTPPGCRSRRSSSAVAAHDRPAGDRGERLGARRVPRVDHGVGDDRGARPARSASCASTRWRCCRSAATTSPTTSPTGCRSARPPTRHQAAGSSSSTGSAATTTAASCGPGFGENSRVLKWIFERVDGDADASTRRSAAADPGRSTPTASTSTTRTSTRSCRSTSTAGSGDPADPRALRAVRRPAPGEPQRRGRRARSEARWLVRRLKV
jgi:phosphoenolpyruvate carboxykinase (GTP)